MAPFGNDILFISKGAIMNCSNPTCTNKTKLKHHKYCSRSCHMIVRNAKLGKREVKPCECCSKPMCVVSWEKSTKRYCSRECKAESLRVERLPITCSLDGCSNVFSRTAKQLTKHNHHYCSAKCSSVAGRIAAQNVGKKTNTRPEIKFSEWCKANEIEFIHQYDVPWKKGWKKWYDFYLPSFNLLVEIDGVYWHGKGLNDSDLNNQQQVTRKNDVEKNKLAAIRGYNLLRLWEDELENLNINKIKVL